MPRATLHATKPHLVTIETSYADRYLIKQLPGARYDGDTRTWYAPLTWATCITLRGLFGKDLELSDELTQWGWEERRFRVEPALAVREAVSMDGVFEFHGDFNGDLYPFQQAGVEFLSRAGSAILMDEMGSGKTVQMIRTLIGLEDPYPALVVCPNSVKAAWEREFARWAPDVQTQLVHGGAGARRDQLNEKADVYIINWEALRLHSRLAGYGSYALSENEKTNKELNNIKWRTIIGDELHRIKSPTAKQTRAAWYLAKDAKYRYGLTGTPIANKPDDFWSLLHFISPFEFPSKTRYVDRWLEKSFNFWGGMDITGFNESTKAELFKITDPRTRRMPKSIVLPQLPPKTMIERNAEMTPKQAKAYKQMAKEYIAMLDDESFVTSDNPLVRAKRLSQFASSYFTIDDQGRALLDEPSNKLDVMVELLEELEDEQLVIFAESRRLIELAAKRLEKLKVPHGLITGKIDAVQRQSVINEFQAGNLRVVAATMAAGGTGITLTASKFLVRLQRSWNSIDNMQAEDRIHRIGSEIHDKVTIIDVIAPHTIEERQLDVLAGKYGNLQAVVRDKELMKKIAEGTD